MVFRCAEVIGWKYRKLAELPDQVVEKGPDE